MIRNLHLRLPLLATMMILSPFLKAEEKKPNVLFIAVDDLNDWVGCLKGHPQTVTPNLDRLAARGVLFTNAHCAVPVCLASRTAVMSGMYPQQTGVYGNWGEGRGKPPARDLQLPVHFSNAGYETFGGGKIYHNAPKGYFDEYFNTEQRWSPFTHEQSLYSEEEQPTKGSNCPKHVVKAGPGNKDWVLPLNGLPSERNPDTRDGESFDWGAVDVKDEEMGDARITAWAVGKMAEQRSKPFFLGVGYYRPHIPLFAPQRDFDTLPGLSDIRLPEVDANDLADLGPDGRALAVDSLTGGSHALVTETKQWAMAVKSYLACVTFVDRQIGLLIDQLDRSAHAENTWIVVWSDHGWHLGEKQHWGKWTGWRCSTRVPLMIVPPRGMNALRGRECAEPVSLVDLYPTLVEVCGLPTKVGLQGDSLAPLLNDPDKCSRAGVLTTFGQGNYAFSTREWRYIRYKSGEEELYQISSDPHEWHNLAPVPRHQTKLGEIRLALEAKLAELGGRGSATPIGKP